MAHKRMINVNRCRNGTVKTSMLFTSHQLQLRVTRVWHGKDGIGPLILDQRGQLSDQACR